VILYQASKSQFLYHALRDDIEDVVSRHYRSVAVMNECQFRSLVN
jgi:hypothetical protein